MVPDLSTLFSNSHLVGPGFPLIIALLFSIFGNTILPIIIFNAIISALLSILIFYLGKLVFSREVGLFSAIWSVFFAQYIFFVPYILKEILFCFLFVLLFIFYLKSINEKKIGWSLVIFGLTYIYLIHTDERFFVYFPIFFIFFIFFDKNNWKDGFKKGLIFFIMTIILMIPWSIRNYKVYNRPVILTERTAKFTDGLFGYNSNYINKLKKKKEMKTKVYEQIDVLFDYYSYNLVDSVDLSNENINSILAKENLLPNYLGTLQKIWLKGELKYNIKPHKFSFFRSKFEEFKEYWRPYRFSPGFVADGYRFAKPWSMKHNIAQGITYGLLLPFFILSIYYIFKTKNNFGVIILIIIFIHMVIHVFLSWVVNRYRVPTDAFIIICSFYGLISFIDDMKNKVFNK